MYRYGSRRCQCLDLTNCLYTLVHGTVPRKQSPKREYVAYIRVFTFVLNFVPHEYRQVRLSNFSVEIIKIFLYILKSLLSVAISYKLLLYQPHFNNCVKMKQTI